MMITSTDCLPLNFGFTGKGNTSSPEGLSSVIKAGACGLKLHEVRAEKARLQDFAQLPTRRHF